MNHHLALIGPGHITVSATEPVPGLHVYKIPDNVSNGITDHYRWRIGHHSGSALLIADTQKDAEAGATAIADLTDWTVDRDTLQTALNGPGFAAMRALTRRHRCYPAGY